MTALNTFEGKLNSNIRCIEIVILKFNDGTYALLNSNIRCIEIVMIL